MSGVPVSVTSRIVFLTLAGVLGTGALLMPISTSFSAQKENPDALFPKEARTLQTKDGGTIHIDYYKSSEGKDAPVIVLLHMKDGNRFIWHGESGFAQRLQNEGYAVITVDLRYHGESKDAIPAAGANPNVKKKVGKGAGSDLKPADYKAMVEYDMEAVKKFIYQENQEENLNMNKMAIVGPEMGASIAATFAAVDWEKPPYPDGQVGFQTPRGQDVRALVLISPQASYHGLVMAQAINILRNPQYKVAMLFAVGKSDTQDKGQAKKLFEQASAFGGKEERIFLREYPGKLRGTDMIGKRLGLEEHMLALFGEHLKKADGEWRDRQSKLDKKK